jgi:hypothetical protein
MHRVVAGIALCLALASAQECPSYTKNRDTLEAFDLGVQNSLFAGFVVYRINNQQGLYRTPLQSYDPQIVPGTESASPFNITLSDDGLWVMFFDSESQELVIQRLDGTGRMTSWMWGIRTGGFYRRSPHGTEIYYFDGTACVSAMQVNLSGEQAQLLDGTQRSIVDLGWERRLDGAYANSGSSVVADQVFLREDDPANPIGYAGRTAFITIPDSGRGTAGLSNIHPWTDTSFEALWGCGHAMSHDGVFCLANSSLIGSACVPNRLNDPAMDHKGFYITKFWRDTDPPVLIHEIADVYGTSINWAPPAYRQGLFDEVDFTGWQFSNDPRFVVGALGGTRLEEFGLENGLWVVNWVSNTWTRITPDSLLLQVADPAIHFTDPNPVLPGARTGSARVGVSANPARVVMLDAGRETGTVGASLYSLDGSLAGSARTRIRRLTAGVYVSAPSSTSTRGR